MAKAVNYDILCDICGKTRAFRSGDHTKCSKIRQAKYANTKHKPKRNKIITTKNQYFVADMITDK